MAIENPILVISFKAAEDLRNYQYCAVTQLAMTNGTVGLMNAATDPIVGILQNAPNTGEVAQVMVAGISKMVANALIAVGVLVKAEYNSTSDCGKADAADTSTDKIVGTTVFASGAEDDLCSVLLCLGSTFSTTHSHYVIT